MSTELSPAVVPADVEGSVQGAVAASAQVEPSGLTAREREMLAFERQWWRAAGAKETAMRTRFELSPTRYYQVLNALVDRPAALVADPLLVGRLRRVRSARQRTRPSQGPGH